MRSEPTRDLFLGHFPLLPPYFSTTPYSPSPFFSHHISHLQSESPPHRPDHHHHCASAPLPITTVGLPITPFLYFSIFFPIFSQTQLLPTTLIFFPIFECPKAQSSHGLCPFDFCVGLIHFCRGLG